jgi:hypothetical protein
VTAIVRLAIGDFRERSRRIGFLIMLVAGVWSANLFLPPAGSRYATVQILGHRPLYGSATVGTLVAILTTVFFGLAGFYLVKDAIERDRQTGVGDILAATGLSKPAYTLAKALSNFFALASLTAVLAISAGVIQMVRGEDRSLDVIALVTPFVWVSLPYMALIAAAAVLFEATPGLRGGLGNVVWFFAWISSIAQQAIRSDNPLSPWRDPTGLHAVMNGLIAATRAAAHTPPGADLRMSIGFNIRSTPWELATFPWDGFAWTPAHVAPRLFWFVVAVALAAVAAIPFDRFDRARAFALGGGTRAATPDAAPIGGTGAPDHVPDMARLASLPVKRAHGIVPLVASEIAVALKAMPKMWFVVAIGAAITALFLPLPALPGISALLWIWPILVWSECGTREARNGTAALFDSAPRPLSRQLPATWLANVAIALALTAPIGIRLALAGESAAALTWAAGVLFVPAFACACGALSGTPRLFEALYLVLWYAGPVNRVPRLDYGGGSVTGGLVTAAGFAVAAAAGLVIAHFARRQRLAA